MATFFVFILSFSLSLSHLVFLFVWYLCGERNPHTRYLNSICSVCGANEWRGTINNTKEYVTRFIHYSDRTKQRQLPTVKKKELVVKHQKIAKRHRKISNCTVHYGFIHLHTLFEALYLFITRKPPTSILIPIDASAFRRWFTYGSVRTQNGLEVPIEFVVFVL